MDLLTISVYTSLYEISQGLNLYLTSGFGIGLIRSSKKTLSFSMFDFVKASPNLV